MQYGIRVDRLWGVWFDARHKEGTINPIMKLLNGKELASYIQERQARTVRNLLQAHDIHPKLAIIIAKDDPVIETYVKLKKRYGDDILVDVALHRVDQSEVPNLLQDLNTDDSVHGIIIQLPLADPAQTDELVNMVAADKDVDALGVNSQYDPATPMAILWLLAGYNIDLPGKRVVLVGRGKLVGAPLERIFKTMGISVSVVDREASDIASIIGSAEVIITATGSPALITSEMVPQGCIIVDAGVAVESGRTVGDLDPSVYERDDLTITPVKGGVGPLTVCALFENVIRAAQKRAGII